MNTKPKEYTMTNGSYAINYRLIENTLPDEEGGTRPSFTLVIQKDSDTVVLEDFTHLPRKALPLLEQFCRESVLPEEAPYIMEDLLSDFDFVQ
ncbi:MAG: hypothetical protein IJZ37_05755 [Clostridia bacterium]|nr:hypothetical protein [Clostridia bacterium]